MTRAHETHIFRVWTPAGIHGLWCIDANLKLRFWGEISVSGGVDADSGTILWLQVNTNMECVAPFHCFIKAREEFNVTPKRVRVDGQENLIIGRYMNAVRGNGSIIQA